MMPKTIEVNPIGANVIYEDGSKEFISVPALLDSLTGARNISTPLLPANCVRYSHSGIYHTLDLFYPKCVGKTSVSYCSRMDPSDYSESTLHDIMKPFNDESTASWEEIDGYAYFNYQVPTPATLMRAVLIDTVNAVQINYVKMFAVPDCESISSLTKLYHFPFGNVGAGDAGVCWGGSGISFELSSIQSANAFKDLFFATPFNNDLDNASKFKLPEDFHDLRDVSTLRLLRYLHGRDEFPDQILLPRADETYSDI